MVKEIEAKLWVLDEEKIKDRLKALGAKFEGKECINDLYFIHKTVIVFSVKIASGLEKLMIQHIWNLKAEIKQMMQEFGMLMNYK